jgi:aerobic-type carbon monoxide dehydrogenase small subunit (CoxS/CutS family)
MGMMKLTVNGVARPLAPGPERSLLYVLREELGLTGAKYGCGEGECGACTVLLDGQAVRACLLPAHEAAGRAVTTVEGLAAGGALHPVQQAFVDAGAMQCGYCTPGMIMATVALLARRPAPSDAEIVDALDGNLCRCCGYPRIREAVARAIGSRAGGGPPSERAEARKDATPALGPITERPGAPSRSERAEAPSERAEARKDATPERGAAERPGAPSRSERAEAQ